jgi:hypothetical protein
VKFVARQVIQLPAEDPAQERHFRFEKEGSIGAED